MIINPPRQISVRHLYVLSSNILMCRVSAVVMLLDTG
jgi:hypothetical protein